MLHDIMELQNIVINEAIFILKEQKELKTLEEKAKIHQKF